MNVRLKEKRKDLLTQRFIWQNASKKADKSIDIACFNNTEALRNMNSTCFGTI